MLGLVSQLGVVRRYLKQDCFASLLSKIDSKFEEETISHIHISRNENFLDPHVVDATAPVSINYVISSPACMYASF